MSRPKRAPAKPRGARRPGATVRLFVATPTADGIMLAGHVRALVAMLAHLQAAGIATEYRTLDGTSLIHQRNSLAHDFLSSACTHLLFIDSDMTFRPDLAEQLLQTGKPLIGAVYPKRRLDYARLETLLAERAYDDALALAHEWNVVPLDGRITLKDGLCRVLGLPGGFLLVARACLEEAAEHAPRLAGDPDRPGLRAVFAEMHDGETVVDLDYAFCRRHAARGGEVWAYAEADIRHLGDDRSDLPFSAYLQTLQPRGSAERPQPAEADALV